MTCGFRWSGPAGGSLPKERGKHLLLVCVAAVLLASCSRPAKSLSAVVITHEINPQPVRVGSAEIILNVADPAAKPVTGAQIVIEADMSHPGMAPVFGDAKEIAPGRYEAQLEFGMAGDWVILVHVMLPGGKVLQQQFEVMGVRPN
jgi:hypothetical protein